MGREASPFPPRRGPRPRRNESTWDLIGGDYLFKSAALVPAAHSEAHGPATAGAISPMVSCASSVPARGLRRLGRGKPEPRANSPPHRYARQSPPPWVPLGSERTGRSGGHGWLLSIIILGCILCFAHVLFSLKSILHQTEEISLDRSTTPSSRRGVAITRHQPLGFRDFFLFGVLEPLSASSSL
jgi:hypothetical protein